MTDPVYVAVVGPGVASPEEEAWAEELGGRLAAAGAMVVCGGSTGVMEAVARGCEAGGGTCIGILPGSDRREGNPHLTFSLPTGMGELRNALIARVADVVVAVGGEFGTLSEIAFALKIGRPVVGLATWDLVRRGEPVPGIHRAESPEEAVAAALGLARD